MLESVALVALGLALLAGGGECLLRGAVGLATLARLTPAVIGLTVVAAGTSVPELAVGVVAAAQGKADVAVGNVVGSNIFNVTVVLGLAAVVRPLTFTGNTVRLEYPVLVLVTLLCLAVCDHGVVGRMDAVAFLAVYVGFMAYVVGLVRRGLAAGETGDLAAEARELEPGGPPPRLLTAAGLVAAGVALLTFGANATVEGAVGLGRLVGMTEREIGLTIVAAGTGLPEVVTSVVASVRGRADVAVGNVVGSNLFNVLVVLGVNGLIAPLPIAPEIAAADAWWMLGVTLLLVPIMATGRRIGRAEGAVLLAVYVGYTALLLRR